MRDLTDAELAAKYPHGWAVEIKRRTLADGTVREYVCRRKKKPAGPRKEKPAVCREIKEKIQSIPLSDRHKVLKALDKLIQSESSDSDEDSQDSDE